MGWICFHWWYNWSKNLPPYSTSFNTNFQKLIFIENVDNDIQPYINISGTVTDSNQKDSSFSMRPSQYCNLLHQSHEFPAHLFITNSKRWSSKKPLPAIGSGVSIGGFLHHIQRNSDQSLSSFNIDISNIAYITNHIELASEAGPSQSSCGPHSHTWFNYKAHRSSTPKHEDNTKPGSSKCKSTEIEDTTADSEDAADENEQPQHVPAKRPHTENI